MRWRMFLLSAVLAAGCASVDKSAMNERMAKADRAGRAGNWQEAVRTWESLVSDFRLADVPAKQRSIIHYEFGRALGVTCQWERATKHLERSLDIDQANEGPVHMTLVELMRLKMAQRYWQAAVDYGDRAVEALQDVNAHNETPGAFHVILQDYATALDRAGRGAEAATVREHAAGLKGRGKKRGVVGRTPHGRHCG